MSNNKHLLPKNFKPSHYILYIYTDLEKLNFEGKVTINLDVLKDSSEIILHSLNLKIKEESIKIGSSKCQKLLYDEKKSNNFFNFSRNFQKRK